MTFYDSVLRNANRVLSVDETADPSRPSAFKLQNLSFKSKPKSNVSVDTNFTKQQEAGKDATVKTATKVGINHGDCTTNYAFANDKFGFGWAAEVHSDGDLKVHTSGSAELKPAKKEWKVEPAVTVASGDIGGAKIFANLAGEYNNKGDITFKPKLNINYEDFHAGVWAEHKHGGETKKLLGQLVYKQKDLTAFARVDKTQEQIGVGCTHFHDTNREAAYELVHNWGKDFKGLKELPLFIRWGASYKLGGQTSIHFHGEHSKNHSFAGHVSHSVDSHWTVGAHHEFDCKDIESTQGPYQFGIDLTYKL